jgi:hypothetical protein
LKVPWRLTREFKTKPPALEEPRRSMGVAAAYYSGASRCQLLLGADIDYFEHPQ